MKTIIVTAAFCMTSLTMYGQTPQNGQGIQVYLQVTWEDPTIGQNNFPKSPIPVPYVTLDDHTLYIWSQHNGYALTLLDDNDTVVYQSYVAAGVQYAVLPTTLSGNYTLVLSDDTYMFTGIISL